MLELLRLSAASFCGARSIQFEEPQSKHCRLEERCVIPGGGITAPYSDWTLVVESEGGTSRKRTFFRYIESWSVRNANILMPYSRAILKRKMTPRPKTKSMRLWCSTFSCFWSVLLLQPTIVRTNFYPTQRYCWRRGIGGFVISAPRLFWTIRELEQFSVETFETSFSFFETSYQLLKYIGMLLETNSCPSPTKSTGSSIFRSCIIF
jgi:hypothetical protein